MRKRLLPLLIVAALMFGGPVAYGKVSPELSEHEHPSAHRDLIEAISGGMLEAPDVRGFCDFGRMHADAPSLVAGAESPWTPRQGRDHCVLPVPPRDIFEHIALGG